ncbi:MAG: hypothetical protein ACYTEQ_03615 [Planctomycetota bacterium]|jgi:hypothetical protein
MDEEKLFKSIGGIEANVATLADQYSTLATNGCAKGAELSGRVDQLEAEKKNPTNRPKPKPTQKATMRKKFAIGFQGIVTENYDPRDLGRIFAYLILAAVLLVLLNLGARVSRLHERFERYFPLASIETEEGGRGGP